MSTKPRAVTLPKPGSQRWDGSHIAVSKSPSDTA
jgi:hypothetical protein